MILTKSDKEREQLAQCICTLKRLEEETDSAYEQALIEDARSSLEIIHVDEVKCSGKEH